MKRAILLNTPELPCPGTHYFHTVKFLSSFTEHGFTPIEASTLEQFVSISPDSGDIVYISNHGATSDSGLKVLQSISHLDCVFVLWFFHDVLEEPGMPKFKRWILTGEHFRQKPKTDPHVRFWEMQKGIPNYVPLTFATSIKPDEIGRFQRNEQFKASFVGAPYQIEWCKKLHTENEGILIRYTPPFIDEKQRVAMYLSSVVSLGFHSDNNAANSVLVERVFEGLALGNVVVSDNPVCEEATDGIVKLVTSYDSLHSEIEKWWSDPISRKLQQERGMSWCKSHGTYTSVSKSFIDMMGRV